MNNIKIAKTALQITIDALESGKESIDKGFSESVELIKNKIPPGRLIVMGMGKSGHIGSKLAATFASTGTPAFFVHPAEAGHGDLGMVTEEDVILAISQSGESDELMKLIPFIKRNKIPLISFTGVMNSSLSKNSQLVINTAISKEACPLDLAPTASTSLTLALGDSLAVCLLESRGFGEMDFASTHPLGKLGKKLTIYVEDIMSLEKDSAIIHKNTSIQESLLEITSAGLGFAVIVGDERNPLGVFTDGDLRRCLDARIEISKVSISDVMIKEFSSVEPQVLAVEAVEIMKTNKISALPVIDDKNQIKGTINMRQLLQAGVV